MKNLFSFFSRSPKCCRSLYLDLLEQTLTGAILEDVAFIPGPDAPVPDLASAYDARARLVGSDWPSHAHTMVGLKRLRNLRHLITQVLDEDIPGDFIETGVWRGGASIYMRALLAAYAIKNRRVWVADSFAGLPAPNPKEFPADAGSQLHKIPVLAVSLEDVKKNFAKYDMLDNQVVFLKGWFKDTLPTAPIDELAILRLDGDLYESTIQVLDALYNKVSIGGFVIIDDYTLPGCRKAVEDFRTRHGIVDAVRDIDGFSMFWRKT
jgi:O-methyltransferase/8-demethyl-8-(2,3-dimethoxy-alpha-L-rhamnosyl)tetracenomycin-C 4'-O-methyltransferase